MKKNFRCRDCKRPIISSNPKAKFCKCDFKSESPSKPVLLKTSLEVHLLIKRMAESDSNAEWGKKN